MAGVREVHEKILALCEDGVLSWQAVAEACLCYMSSDEVEDMASYNDLLDDDEEEDDDE